MRISDSLYIKSLNGNSVTVDGSIQSNLFVVQNDGVISGNGINADNNFSIGNNGYIMGGGGFTIGNTNNNFVFVIQGANYPTLRFGSVYSTNTYIQQNAGGYGVQLSTNGSPSYLRLTPSSVGINIPQSEYIVEASLDIRGLDSTSSGYSIKVKNSANTPLLYVRNDATTIINGSATPTNTKFYVHGGTNDNTEYSAVFGNNSNGFILAVRNDGAIGINGSADNDIVLNLTNPSAKLVNLRTTDSSGTALFAVFNAGYSNFNGNLFVGGYFVNPTATLQIKGISSTSADYALKIDNSSNTPLLYVRNDGNIGIGVVSPNARLSFGAYVGDNDGIIKILDNGGTDFYGFGVSIANGLIYSSGLGHTFKFGAFNKFIAKATFGMNTNDNVDVMLSLKSETTTSAKWNLISYDSANNSLFCINNDGNIGIGNNPTSGTPTARFYVKSASSTSTDYALKVDNSSNTPLLYVRNNGNVGIGTTLPSERLEVNGQIKTTAGNILIGEYTGVPAISAIYMNVVPAGNNYTIARTSVGTSYLNGNLLAFSINGTIVGQTNATYTQFTQNFAVGTLAPSGTNAFVVSGETYLRGISSTPADYALKVDNSSNTPLLYVRDDGFTTIMDMTVGRGGGLSQYNTALGVNALFNNTTANRLVAIGWNTLSQNTTGFANTGIGYNSLSLNNGSNNTAVGSDSMSNNASGVGNVGIGVAALSSNQTGSNNVVISANSGGQGALSSNISGSRNIAIGMYCAYSQTNLDETIAIGSAALYTNISGSGNVAFGNNALRLNTLGGNLAIGNSAGKNQTVASNMFFIDNQDRGSAANELINSLIVGTFAGTAAGQILRFNANVGFNGTSFGGGVGVLFKGFAATTPTTNPIGGVIDYVENTGSGVQKYRDTNGTIIAY